MHDAPMQASQLADQLVVRSEYVKKLRPELPPEMFEPATSRLLVIPAALTVIGAAITAVAMGVIPWFVLPLISLVIGVAMSCLTFMGHEAVHGGIVRGRTARQLVGWIGFLPFTVSPRLWAAWHDRVHHGSANSDGDPDMYPTLDEYHANGRARFFINWFSPGNGKLRGVLSLALGFSLQALMQLINARSRDYLSARNTFLAIVETLLGVALWATVAVLVGAVPFLFVYVIPLLIANTIVMSYILTNHSLSPRVTINDPVISGLSVTTPRWYERLTLNFGYHVEHHVFPAMSSRHARAVRDLLKKHWPQRYQSMPLSKALLQLHRTPRVYKDAVTLVDPRTGREFPTLLPG